MSDERVVFRGACVSTYSEPINNAPVIVLFRNTEGGEHRVVLERGCWNAFFDDNQEALKAGEAVDVVEFDGETYLRLADD